MVRGLNSSTESELEWLEEFAKGALFGQWPGKPITEPTRFSKAIPHLVILQIPGVRERDCFKHTRSRECRSKKAGREVNRYIPFSRLCLFRFL